MKGPEVKVRKSFSLHQFLHRRLFVLTHKYSIPLSLSLSFPFGNVFLNALHPCFSGMIGDTRHISSSLSSFRKFSWLYPTNIPTGPGIHPLSTRQISSSHSLNCCQMQRSLPLSFERESFTQSIERIRTFTSLLMQLKGETFHPTWDALWEMIWRTFSALPSFLVCSWDTFLQSLLGKKQSLPKWSWRTLQTLYDLGKL